MAQKLEFELYGGTTNPINPMLIEPIGMLLRKIIYVARARFAVIGVGIEGIPIGSSIQGITDKPLDIAIRFNSIDPKIRKDVLYINDKSEYTINDTNLRGSLTDLNEGTFIYKLMLKDAKSISVSDLDDLIETEDIPDSQKTLVSFPNPTTITLQLVISYLESDISTKEANVTISRALPGEPNIMAIPAAVCKDTVSMDFSRKDNGQATITVNTTKDDAEEIQMALVNILGQICSNILETRVFDRHMSETEIKDTKKMYEEILSEISSILNKSE